MKTKDLLKDETIVGNPKKHLAVLENFSLAASMLIAMAAAVVINTVM